MKSFEFKHKVTLTPAQRIEMERYLGISGFNELTMLKLIRKMKQLEEKMRNKKYD